MDAADVFKSVKKLAERSWATSLAQEAAAWRAERMAHSGTRTIVSRQGRPVPVVLKSRKVQESAIARRSA